MKIIARIRSDFPEKFGIPRQSGLIEELKARIVFEPEYRNPDALRGLEGYSHLWLICSSRKLFGRAGLLRCVRRAWEEIRELVFLQRALHFGRTRSVCHR